MADSKSGSSATDYTIDDPIIERREDGLWAVWPNYLIRMRFSELRESRGGLACELTIFLDLPDVPVPAEWTTLDLTNGQSRAQIANRLRENWVGPAGPPWRELLGIASYEIRERFRTGEVITRIGEGLPVQEPSYVVSPILVENQIAILYGDGASLKSLTALILGLSVQTRKALLPGTTVTEPDPLGHNGRVLYLDYETSAGEQNRRIQRLAAGFGLEGYGTIDYRESRIPLAREGAILRALVGEYDSRLVIVDSLGAAMGGDPNEAENVIAAMNVLRSLGTTVLALDHVTKVDDSGKPIGSVYKFNYTRSGFQAKRVQEEDSDDVRVILLHRKSNNGRLVSPLGLAFRFEGETGPIRVKRTELRDDPEMAKHTTLASRILYQLGKGSMRAPDLKDALVENDEGIKPNTFNRTFKRLIDAGRIAPLPDGRYGLTQ